MLFFLESNIIFFTTILFYILIKYYDLPLSLMIFSQQSEYFDGSSSSISPTKLLFLQLFNFLDEFLLLFVCILLV